MSAACKCSFKRVENGDTESGLAITSKTGVDNLSVMFVIPELFQGWDDILGQGDFIVSSVVLDWTMAITTDETMPAVTDDTTDEHLTQREREGLDQDSVKSTEPSPSSPNRDHWRV